MTDTEHLDITNLDAIREVVKREKIDAIVNCAAWTDSLRRNLRALL